MLPATLPGGGFTVALSVSCELSAASTVAAIVMLIPPPAYLKTRTVHSIRVQHHQPDPPSMSMGTRGGMSHGVTDDVK